MTTSVRSGLRFDAAQVAVLAVVARAETLPDVLGTGPTHRSARAEARECLRRDGVLDDDEVTDPGLVRALRTLTDPALEVSMRCARQWLHAVLAVDAGTQVLAVHTDERVSVSEVWAEDPRSAARALGGVLDLNTDPVDAATVPSARFPLRRLTERLSDCRDVHDVAAAFAAEGLSDHEAFRLSDAVSSASRRTEIVARGRADGLPITSVGAIAVLDGPAGRVIAGPDLAVDGTPWTTFSPGTSLRLEQSLGRLVATLPREGNPWDTSREAVA